MVAPSDLNPLGALGLSKFDIGLGDVGNVLALGLICLLIIGLVGFLVYYFMNKKKFRYTIPLYALVGNRPTRIGMYKAKEIPMGKAGDRLWYCKGIKKYIQPAQIQSANGEFWHWQRSDGEWINFALEDLDEKFQKAGVKYIQQDVRLARLATDRLLEQRLMNKNFWEKWGVVIGYAVFFLVIAVSMVIIFYQFSKVVETMGQLIGQVDTILQRESKQGGELVPVAGALIPLLWGFKHGE